MQLTGVQQQQQRQPGHSEVKEPKSAKRQAMIRGMGHGARASAVNGHNKTRPTEPHTHDNSAAPRPQPKALSPLQRGQAGG